jgi:subtilase family serine protease
MLSASKSAAQKAHTNYVVVPQSGLQLAASTPTATNPTGTGLTPAQVRQAYGIDQISFNGGVIGDGTGETIAIVDAFDDPNIQSDLNTFDVPFNLPNITVTRISETGSTTNLPKTDSTGGWEEEEALDVEWAHAIAPGASIVLVEANSTSNSDLFQAVTTARNYSGVVVVSMSFSGGESSGETSNDSIFTSPSGRGVTFLAATGDDGEPSGYPAYSPNVVAVGGTVLSVPVNGGNNFTGNYTSEIGWPNPIIASATESGNTVTITASAQTPVDFTVGDSVTIAGVANSSYDGTFTVKTSTPAANQFTYTLNNFSNLAASSGGTAIGDNNGGSGGGQSTVEGKPTYQNGVQSSTHRSNPDVSIAAVFQDSTGREYGVNVYDSFDSSGWEEVGGTSLATPIWAGLIAIADQGRSLLGLGSLDGRTQTLPLLYQLPASDFHDITSGNNGFAATAGYDMVTGIGSPLANLVVQGLVGVSTTISGTVFVDTNGNGVQDSGESGQAGVTVYDDINNNGVYDPILQTSYSSANVPVSIPTRSTNVPSTLAITDFSGTIVDLNVTLNISDSSDSSITITLVSPGGTQITLANRDGFGSNFTGTVFDDQATTSISNGSPPFNGSYMPITALSAVNGTSADGTWTLEISNSSRFSSGTLNSWSLQISSGADFSTTTDANGNYEFVNVSPGEHHIRELTPNNYTETAPAGGVYDVSVSNGSNVSGLNFANAPAVPPPVLGDFNRNGVRDAGDISAAMMALTNLDEYLATYGVTPDQLATFDDVNQDGGFNNADLQALLSSLISGGSSSSPTGHQIPSGSTATGSAISQMVSMSAIKSEGYTDPQPVMASTGTGKVLPTSISALRKLLMQDLQDKLTSEHLRLLRISGHITSYSGLEKFFETWVG